MLSVTSTLLDAARSGSAAPYVRVRMPDRYLGVPRLRFVRWYEGSELDGPSGVAVTGDGTLVRARIDPSTDTLYLQRTVASSAESAYDSWSSFATAEASAGLGLHAAGARVLVAYYDGDDVLVRESTDHGATFASAVTVATVSGVTAVACGIRSDGEALAVWAAGGVVYRSMRPALGSWGTPAAWTHTLDVVNALAAGDTEDWAVLVSGEDTDGAPGCWSAQLGSGVGGPPGHWSALRPVAVASPGLDVTYRARAVAVAGAPRAALVESYAGTGAFDRALLTTGLAGGTFEDGEWREVAPFTYASPWGVALASGGGHIYASGANSLWHASAAAPHTDITDAVLAVTYEADHVSERLRLTLDASLVDESGASVEPGVEVEFSPGYVTDAGFEVASGRALWVTSVTRSLRDGRSAIEVEAEGALGHLSRWRAGRLAAWHAGERSVLASVREVARLAGVRVASDGVSAAATTLTPGFTLRPGESAATAIGRLLARTPDHLTGRGSEVVLREPDPEDAADSAYGLDHPVITMTTHEPTEGIGAVRVHALDALGEAVAEGTRNGRILTVVDEGLTTAEQAEDRAFAMLRRNALARDLATLDAPPHPGQEPGDVIEVTYAPLGLDGIRYRVRSVRIDFARSARGRYLMRLGLGAP